jgi:hypothetical protein
MKMKMKGIRRYKLDIVGVQEIRWNNGDMVKQGITIFSMEKETTINNWELDLLYTIE